jgi:hypothetical protein
MRDVSDRNGCTMQSRLSRAAMPRCRVQKSPVAERKLEGALHAGAPGGLAGAKPSRQMSGERL